MADKRTSYDLRQSPFFRLRAKRKLAALLQLSLSQLSKFSTADYLYNEWDSKVGEGKIRRIESPRSELAKVQRRIAELLSRVTLPDFLYCPAKGRSYVTNAKQHSDGKQVLCLDVASYFPSTPSRRVFWFFNHVMECSPDVAAILTSLASYKGHLPTGSSLSPLMSFYAHWDMWQDIGALVREAGCKITVYMDDITISGTQVPEKLIWVIKKRIYRNGLRYHKQKRFSGEHPREVTGVILDQGRVKLPHRQHKKIYGLRRDIRRAPGEVEREMLNRRLQGRIAQAQQVARANDQGAG
jgi:retron-type reverse transcriptase